MITQRDINIAYVLAKTAHMGQKDKAGIDYIEHPKTVAGFVDTPEEKVCALLHDVLEDTEVTKQDLQLLFDDNIVNTVDCLTHKENESYDKYIERIKQNPLATRVKLADLKHNSDLTRLPNITEKDLQRIKKYQNAIKYLK